MLLSRDQTTILSELCPCDICGLANTCAEKRLACIDYMRYIEQGERWLPDTDFYVYGWDGLMPGFQPWEVLSDELPETAWWNYIYLNGDGRDEKPHKKPGNYDRRKR